MKINANAHALVDCMVVVFLLSSPWLFSLPPVTAKFTFSLAAVHFLLTILTDYKMGIMRAIPLKIHGMIELLVSFVLVGVAFYLNGIEGMVARNFYLGFAIAVFIVWLLTEYSYFKK